MSHYGTKQTTDKGTVLKFRDTRAGDSQKISNVNNTSRKNAFKVLIALLERDNA